MDDLNNALFVNNIYIYKYLHTFCNNLPERSVLQCIRIYIDEI